MLACTAEAYRVCVWGGGGGILGGRERGRSEWPMYVTSSILMQAVIFIPSNLTCLYINVTKHIIVINNNYMYGNSQ